MKDLKFKFQIIIDNQRNYNKPVVLILGNNKYIYQIQNKTHTLTIKKNDNDITIQLVNSFARNKKIKYSYKKFETIFTEYYNIHDIQTYIALLNFYKKRYDINTNNFVNDINVFYENVFDININLLHFMNLFYKLLNNKTFTKSIYTNKSNEHVLKVFENIMIVSHYDVRDKFTLLNYEVFENNILIENEEDKYFYFTKFNYKIFN